jgi:hypothetical protein
VEKLLGRGDLFQGIVGCCAGKDPEVFGFPSNPVWVMYNIEYIDIVVQGLGPGPSACRELS